MSRNNTSTHQNEWRSHFRGVSGFVGRAALNVLGDMAPAIKQTTVTLPSDVMRESKNFITKTRSQITYQAKALSRNINGRQASNILSEAMSDIQSGSFSFGRIDSSSEDMVDDFDSYMDKVDSEASNSDDPAQAALVESKKNSAMVGKAIAQGNVATIKGLENMTDVLANVTVKTANANFIRSQNTTLMGINQMNAGFSSVTGRLDTINSNLVSMIDFQRENIAVINQQTAQFQLQTLDMMNTFGEGIAEIRDFIQFQKDNIEKQNTFRNPKKDEWPLDFSNGINFDDYKELVKKNYNNSILSFASMFTSFLPMMLESTFADKGAKDLIAEKVIEGLIPKKVRKSIKRTDKMFGRTVQDLLYRVGDLKGSDNQILSTIGQIFGIQKQKFTGPNVADFKRDAMSWNGIAQKTLVTVIPNYLARIESALTGKEERYYNMDKGKFQSRTRIGNEYNTKLNNDISNGMDDFKTKFRKTIKDEADRDDLMKEFSDIIENQIVAGLSDGNISKTRQEMIKQADELLRTRSNIDQSKVYDMIIELTDNIDETLQQLSKNFNSAQEHLFNDEERSTREYFKMENVFTEKYKTSQGLRFDMLNKLQQEEEILMKRFAKYMDKYVASNGKLWKDLTFAEKRREMEEENFRRAVMNKESFDNSGIWEVKDPDDETVFDDLGSVGGFIGGIYKRAKKRIKNIGNKRGSRFSNAIDRGANFMYQKFHGLGDYDYFIDGNGNPIAPISAPGGSSTGAASSNQTQQSGSSQERSTNARHTSNIRNNADALNEQAEQLFSNPNGFQDIIQSSTSDIQRNSNHVNKAVNRALGGNGGNADATIAHLSPEERMLDNENSLKAMVLSMHSNVLAPMAGGIFGKNGVISNFFNENKMKEIRDKLFDEKTGPLGSVTVWFKEKMGEVSHFFTGKGYYDKDHNWHDENENSVFDKLAEGYNFIYENTMTHLFGEEWKDDETYKKYFSWMDWKGKRADKREKRKAAHEEEVKKEKEEALARQALINGKGGVTNNNLIIQNPDGTFSFNPQHTRGTSTIYMGPQNNQAQISSNEHYALPVFDDADIIDVDGTPIIPEDTTEQGSTALAVIKDAAITAADKITEAGTALSTYIVGNEDVSEKAQKGQEETKKTFLQKAKAFLPTGVAAGIAGALVGTSTAIHGAGLLGSLILPGGPISGAILGIGLSMLAKNEKFSNFLFGEKDDDGKRKGGLITKKTQEAFKKNLPLIVGASALGAVKGVIKSAFGMGVVPGPGGFLLNALGPGGMIGGALLGLGVGLLRNNESFNRILWGKEGDDGKRQGGILNKGNGRFKAFMEKSGHFVKGGLKGLGVGAITGAVMSQAGILGSAFSLGGPIGMGIAGLGIGIASQTENFKEMLFGTMEYDKDGKPIGRKGDGLFTKARNLLVTNVFEPIKDKIQENVNDFAFWVRGNLVKPFKLAFGPILDSLSGVKDDIHAKIEDVANTIKDGIKKGFKTLFSPITKVSGFVGKAIMTGLKTTAKASLLPITAPLKILSALQVRKRFKARKEEGATLFGALGDIGKGIINRTKQDWAEDDRDYSGPFGGLNKLLTRGRDIITNTREGFDAAAMGYEDEMTAQGKNHLGWMGEVREERRRKKLKKQMSKDTAQWKVINSVRKQVISENGGAEVAYSDAGLKSIKNRMKKAGIKKEYIDMIQNNQDLNQLLYHRDEFKDRLLGKNKEQSTEELLKNGITVRQDPSIEQENLNYHDKVIARFDTVVQAVTAMTAEKELNKKSNVSLEELAKTNARLAEKGVSWDSMDVDLLDIIDYETLTGPKWDRFMRKFNGDEAALANDNASAFWDQINEIRDDIIGIRKSSEENANINKADLAAETGVPESDIIKAANGNIGGISVKQLIQKRREERKAREEQETLNVITGHARLKAEKDKDGNAKTEGEATLAEGEEPDDKTKKTVFESVGGFFSNLFGKVTGFLFNSSTWAKFGVGALLVGIFGDQIRAVMEGPVGQWVKEKVPEAVKTVGSVISEYTPMIITSMGENIANNMGYIIDAILNVAKSAITTIGGKGYDWIKSKMTGKQDADVRDFDGNTEAARAYAIQNGYDPESIIDGDIVVGEHTYVDENGEYQGMSEGSDDLRAAVLRSGIQSIRSPYTRTLMKQTGKYGWKAAKVVGGFALGGPVGGVIGMLPGGKIIRSIGKAGMNAGNTAGRGIKSLYEKFGKKAATETASNVAQDVMWSEVREAQTTAAKDIAKDASKSGGVIKKFITKMEKLLTESSLVKKISKHMSEKAWLNSVKGFLKNASEKLLKPENVSKAASTITKKSATAVGKTAADATVILGVGFAIYDGISGALDAASLFQISEDDVTWQMRAISSVMHILLGTAVGAWLDILFEVLHMITGTNLKRDFARWLYRQFGDAEALDEAILELEAETDKYNKENGTKLTTEEYSDLKNKDKTVFGWLKRGGTWLFSGEEAYNKKYNYSQYELSNAELEAYKRSHSNSIPSDNPFTSTDITPESLERQQYNGGDLISYGRGPIGYGTKRQDDPRWANHPIGKFPNGETATMATAGCGPTALSMLADKSPVGVADYAKKKGYIQDGGATADLFTKGASDMGLTSHTLNKSSLKTALGNGESVIVSGKSSMDGPYTPASHVIVANGLDSNGNAKVSDPMRGDRVVSIDSLSRGMTHGWSYGSTSYGLGMVGGSSVMGYGNIEYVDVNDPYLSSTYTKKINATKKHIYVWSKAKRVDGTWEDILIDLGSHQSSLTNGEFKGNSKLTEVTELNAVDRRIKSADYERAINDGRVISYSQYKSIVSGDISKLNRAADDITKNAITAGVKQSPATLMKYVELEKDIKPEDSYFFDKKTELAKTKYLFEGSGKGSKEMSSYLKKATYSSQKALDYWLRNAYDDTIKDGKVVKKGSLWDLYGEPGHEMKEDSTDTMTVADLFAIATYHPQILNDIEVFRQLHDFYKGGRYPLDHQITKEEFDSITNVDTFLAQLGMTGQSGLWKLKYGFPFFETDNLQWANIPWGGGTIKNRGTDIASLGMIATAFSPNVITPDYINSNWINLDPNWVGEDGKLDMERVFSNDKDGFNAMKAAQVDGQRLQVTRLMNASEILSALQANKPVVLQGYRYNGGIFGGYYDANGAPMEGADDTGTVIARAADMTHMAVIDPWTTLEQNGIFDTDRLNDTINGTSAIKYAYMVTDPEGNGITGPVNMNDKEGGTSDYIDLSTVHGLDKISALISNFGSIATHIFDSIIDGEDYRSIKEINPIENDGLDETGLASIGVTVDQAKDALKQTIGTDLDRTKEDNVSETFKAKEEAAEDEKLSKGTYWGLVRYTSQNGVKMIDPKSLAEKVKKYGSLSAEEKKVIDRYKDKIPLNKSNLVMDKDVKVAPTNNGTQYYVSSFSDFNSADKQKYKEILRYDDSGKKGGLTKKEKEKQKEMTKRSLIEQFLFPIEGEEGAIWSPFAGWGSGPSSEDNPRTFHKNAVGYGIGGGAKDFIIGYGKKNLLGTEPKKKKDPVTTTAAVRGINYSTDSRFNTSKSTSPTSAYMSLATSMGINTSGALTGAATAADALVGTKGADLLKKAATTKSVGELYKETYTNQIPYDNKKVEDIGNQLDDNVNTAVDNIVSNVTVQAGVKSAEEMWGSLNMLQKLGVIAQAQMAAGFGEDYEEVKRQILESMAVEEAQGGGAGVTTSAVDSTGAAMTSSINISNIDEAYKIVDEKMSLNNSAVEKKRRFIKAILPGVYSLQKQYGLVPSFTVAHSSIESGWGESGLSQKANNLFGVKGNYKGESYTSGTREEDSNGNSYSTSATFRKYPSWEESILDYGGSVLQHKGYGYEAILAAKDYKEAARALNASQYATTHNYDSMIINQVEKNQLYMLDNFVPNIGGSSSSTATVSAIDYSTDPRFTANPKGPGMSPKYSRNSRAIGYGPSWLDVCAKVKAAIAAKRPGYSQTMYIQIDVDGTKMTARPDCSGFVSACISYYTGKHFLTYTGAMLSANAPISQYGFTRLPWSGWQSCQPGDIVVRNGHTCIFAGPVGSNNVWNCGSDKSVNNPGMTQDTSKYTYIWRLNGDVGSLTGANYATTSVTNGQVLQAKAYQSPLEKMMTSMTEVYNKSIAKVTGMSPSADGSINIGLGKGPKGSPQEFFENTLGGITTSDYGNRSSELGNEFHRGLDISADYGKDIISPVDGVLVDSGTDVMGYGNYAVVQDANGNNHVFAHMASPVGYGIGSHISKNSVIGQVGSTGNSTGDHLHYEIRKSGNKYSTVNPNKFRFDRSSDFNIHKISSSQDIDSTTPIGSGNKDLSTQIEDKLNVAINTDNIEDKMDNIISVLGMMATGISDMSKKTTVPVSSSTYNTTVYGKGSDSNKSSTVKSSDIKKKKTRESMTLLEYHKKMTSKK